MDLEIGSCCNLYTEFIFIQEADPEDIIDNRPKKTSIKRGKGGKASSLSDAAATGRLVDVCLAIHAGAKVNALNRRGIAPLHRVSGVASTAVPIALTRHVISVLLAARADVSLPDADGDTPLHIAARAGHDGIVRHLLTAGADPGAENNHQKTARDVAETHGIRQLLARPGDDEDTPHSEAATDDDADPGDVGDDGHAATDLTPADMQALRKAVEANATATVEALLARFVRGPPASIDALDAEGCTCLHLACVHGSTGSAAALVRHGAAVNAASEQADTPLHYATYANHRDIILLLLQHGARPTLQNSDGVSSIDLANGDVLLELQRATSALNAASNSSSQSATPTKSAKSISRRSSSADGPPDVFDADVKGDSRESRKLRQAIMMFRKMEESEKQASAPTPSTRRGRANSGSSKMDAGEKSGSRRGRPPGSKAAKRTASGTHRSRPRKALSKTALAVIDNLHDAVAHGDIDAVADALSRCADVDTPDAHGHTALHICVQYTQLDCAHLVLSANAHVDAPNPRMVKLLLTANASTSVANDDHVTPVEVAKTPAIAQLLRAHAAANEDTAEMGGGSSSGGGRAGKRVRGTSTSGARLSKRSVEARGAKGDVSWSALGHAKGGTDWIGEFQFTQFYPLEPTQQYPHAQRFVVALPEDIDVPSTAPMSLSILASATPFP